MSKEVSTPHISPYYEAMGYTDKQVRHSVMMMGIQDNRADWEGKIADAFLVAWGEIRDVPVTKEKLSRVGHDAAKMFLNNLTGDEE